MKNFTLYYTFNGKNYKSTVQATDRLHAMNLIKNKIIFLPAPEQKDSFDIIDYFNKNIFKK